MQAVEFLLLVNLLLLLNLENVRKIYNNVLMKIFMINVIRDYHFFEYFGKTIHKSNYFN